MMKPLYYRPVQIRGLIFVGLLLLALAIFGGMIWRNLHHFEKVISYVNYSHRIQKVSAKLQQAVIESLTAAGPSPPANIFESIFQDMEDLKKDRRYLSTVTRSTLEKVKSLLTEADALTSADKHAALLTALRVMNEALDAEGLQREKLLENINLDTQFEVYITLVTLVMILCGAMLFLQRRILAPLNDLAKLLEQLTDEHYAPIGTDHLDPLLMPVFKSYNNMVRHLAELEENKRQYTQSLQREVRLATQAILEQQQSLARAERLAAIGEVAAELAHEIRNPLAGLQIAFSNLRRDITQPAQAERLEMISAELKRLAKLSTNILEQSRYAPESASEFDLAALIQDLAALTRYQVPAAIRLKIEISPSLKVRLPVSGVRQALLNLILNSADALQRKKGLILVQAFADFKHGHLRLQVLDDGPGFSEGMLTNGIQAFRTGHQRGTGLGLAMVQRFVRDAGGRIELSNREPRGASVSLFLPDCVL